MKCLVSGGAGFIASNLIEACLRKGWTVISLDNLSTSRDEMADPIRVMDLPGSYAFVKMDVNETERLEQIASGCDIFFHLAAIPRVSYSVVHPLETNRANIDGTLSALEAARRAGVGRFIFAGSSSVFGGVAQFPTPPDAPTHPISNYALQKLAGIEYCRLYSELYGLDTCSLIFFNVFGKYQCSDSSYATVVPAFFESAMNNKPCRIDGDGNQERDLCHVDNVVSALLLAAEHPGKLNGERFNIACGESHSVNEVFENIQKLVGRPLEKTMAPGRLGDPRRSLAEISKSQKVLGYRPLVGFSDGLEKTYAWWKAGCPDRF